MEETMQAQIMAAFYLQKAADKNHREALMQLSRMYRVGEGVEQDQARANTLRAQAYGVAVAPADDSSSDGLDE